MKYIIPEFVTGKIGRIFHVKNWNRDFNLPFISDCYTTRVLS
jgi:hypothetical protein